MRSTILALTTLAARGLRFSKEDEIPIVSCGLKKSMVSGPPMANIIVPAASVELVVLPLMLFDLMQLMVCAALARCCGLHPEEPVAVATVAA